MTKNVERRQGWQITEKKQNGKIEKTQYLTKKQHETQNDNTEENQTYWKIHQQVRKTKNPNKFKEQIKLLKIFKKRMAILTLQNCSEFWSGPKTEENGDAGGEEECCQQGRQRGPGEN